MSQKIIITKPTFNAVFETNPKNIIFSSDYGTLKYSAVINQVISFNAAAPDLHISATGIYTHSLGYYPYCEVFARVYIGSPSGNYEYCPFAGSGATVLYSATYRITTTTIQVYGQINGTSSSIWVFDFMIFLFKNNLNL